MESAIVTFSDGRKVELDENELFRLSHGLCSLVLSTAHPTGKQRYRELEHKLFGQSEERAS